MENSELQNKIKISLQKYMSDEDADHFNNVDNIVSLIKQGQPPWQALVGLFVINMEINNSAGNKNGDVTLEEKLKQLIEPVNALYRSLMAENVEILENEKMRLLFHTRFALASLFLLESDKKNAAGVLHELLATPVSPRGRSYFSGPGVLPSSPDVISGKLTAAFFNYGLNQDDNLNNLSSFTELFACLPSAGHLLVMIHSFIDGCVAEYEKYDYPCLEWVWLFVEIGEILSLVEAYDASGVDPGVCKKESAQYMAWKFGQVAGKFALRWTDDPFALFYNYWSAVGEKDYQSERGEEKTKQTLVAVLDLFREYEPNQDWQKRRLQIMALWDKSDSYAGVPLSEIGPQHDLYWAMRIGFADAFLTSSLPASIESVLTEPTSLKMLDEVDRMLVGSAIQIPQISRERILQLVESGESPVLEFKSSVKWDFKEKKLNDSLCIPVIRTAAAFLNCYGGVIIIGVDDEGEIIGLEHDYQILHGRQNKYTQHLVNKFCHHLGEIACQKYIKINFHNFGKKEVCAMDISPSSVPVYFLENGDEKFYIRIGNETRQLKTRDTVDYIKRTFPRRSEQVD